VTNVSVTVVTSSLARSWEAPLSEVAVAVIALNVSMAFVMPIAGLTAGRYGMRRLLLLGGLTLGVSSAMLLFARDPVLLTVGRLGQGAGLAAMTPTAVQASNNLLSRADHSRALGWWSAANGIGLAVGPVVGGVLFDLGGWVLVPLPTLLIAGLLVVSTLRGVPRGVTFEGPVRLSGVVLLSLMAGVAVTILSALSVGASEVALAGAALLSFLVWVSLARRRQTGLPVHWLRDVMVRRSGTGASVQMLVNGLAQVGVPAWLVTAGIASSSGAGVALLAMTLTMAILGLYTGRRVDVSYARWFRVGTLLLGVGGAGLALAASVAPWWLSLPMLVVTGVGAGCLLTPSFQAFSATGPGKDGVGLAMYNMLRLSSFAVGGILAAAAVDAGAPWVAFAAGTALCLLLGTRPLPAIASPARSAPADAG
jgi:DHA2 family methylenomycin A resistance protein-like MFS transporter